MFFHPPEKITPWMRPTYLALSVILGIVVSYGIRALVEYFTLRSSMSAVTAQTWATIISFDPSAAQPAIQYALFLAGALGCFLTGRMWWRWAYVERRWSTEKTNNT